MVRYLAAVVLIFACMGSAQAQVTLRETVTYYEVDALTLPELREQMGERGPRGYWGYARWNVRSTAECEVTVRVSYTLPKHENLSGLSPTDRAKWEAMIQALEMHERNHGTHGMNAANEIKAAGCSGGWRIIRKWAKQDRVYDRQTQHGRTEGVVLD